MLLVAISLLLRALFDLLDTAVYYYSPHRTNVHWAVIYLYDILTIGIYVGVTGVALIGSASYSDPMPKHEPAIELAPFAQPHVYL